MEENKNQLPIIIKKKNGMMIAAIVMELIVAINFWIAEGIKNICAWLFVFVAVITTISVWDDSCERINLGEYKFEVHKRKDVLESINYEKINTITIEKGETGRNKKKNFLLISFYKSYKKKKKADEKKEKYLVDLTYYSKKDVRKIRDMIIKKNPNARSMKALNEYLDEKK